MVSKRGEPPLDTPHILLVQLDSAIQYYLLHALSFAFGDYKIPYWTPVVCVVCVNVYLVDEHKQKYAA